MFRLSERDKKFTIINGPPVWDPLETVFDENVDIIKNFMYMGTVRLYNGHFVYLYKNELNKKYINIDKNGNTFAYDGNNYKKISQDIAKKYVLSST